nr:CWF19-like protein 1 [Cherax quadricarinatus]
MPAALATLNNPTTTTTRRCFSTFIANCVFKMTDKVEKILVCGDVLGNFKQLFKRVQNVNEKSGPFSMLLCVGDFFGPDNSQWDHYKNGDVKVPVATYVLGPSRFGSTSNYPDMKGCELCENVII